MRERKSTVAGAGAPAHREGRPAREAAALSPAPWQPAPAADWRNAVESGMTPMEGAAARWRELARRAFADELGSL
ncbi:hypothetical protein, partial [Adlercreutzia sp. ZJ305]|uniref:hypothetical protein n=1 Tax=Adlercreutzia sp. ZJ305 TaxID=2709408 RepID=UPI00197DBB0E